MTTNPSALDAVTSHSPASSPYWRTSMNANNIPEASEDEPTWHKDCITLTALQLRHALDFAAPDFDVDEDQRETQVSIAWAPAGATHTDEGDPDPAGYKVWLTDYPEEGSIPLDESPAGFPVKSAERGRAIAAAARAAIAATPASPQAPAPQAVVGEASERTGMYDVVLASWINPTTVWQAERNFAAALSPYKLTLMKTAAGYEIVALGELTAGG